MKTAALLSDLDETLALLGLLPFDLSEKLLWGWVQATVRIGASNTATGASNEHILGSLLEPHKDRAAYSKAVQRPRTILRQVMHRRSIEEVFKEISRSFHRRIC
jgi:hypothetical protein